MGSGRKIVIDKKHGKCGKKHASDPEELHIADKPNPSFHDFDLLKEIFCIFGFVLGVQKSNPIAECYISIGVSK